LNKYKNHIAEIISGAVGQARSDIEPLIEIPPSEDMGDFAFPCFTLAKTMRKAPVGIAAELSGKLATDKLVERIEPNGPYLNFFLNKPHFIASVIDDISSAGDSYGSSDVGSGKKIVLEYSSPNIAKPFGIGHLRSTVIGAALARVYKHQGYDVVSINHLGDWGTQFGKLLYAYDQWGDDAELEANPIEHLYNIYVKVHQEEESNPDVEAATRKAFRDLEDGDTHYSDLWKRFSELSKKEFAKIYNMLGVKFDSDAGEASYIDKIPATEKLLEDKQLLKESREATIVDLEKFGMPPMLIRKSDDTTLYATRDLAAAIFRQHNYSFHKMIYVVGVAQSLYFKQLFKALELMGFDWAKKCEHVSFGWVKLGDEMMSTRRGNIVFLEDVLAKTIEKTKNIIKESSPDLPNPDEVASQVGIGAVVFADLAYKRDTDISFDWDKMLDFKGYSGPYLQYSHARICSVLRKYGKEVPRSFDADLLRFPEEFAIAKKLASYPDTITKAAKENEPQHISSFLLEICGIFNTYYQRYRSPEDRILSTDERTAGARVILTDCIRIVLSSGLKLLGLSAPEMM